MILLARLFSESSPLDKCQPYVLPAIFVKSHSRLLYYPIPCRLRCCAYRRYKEAILDAYTLIFPSAVRSLRAIKKANASANVETPMRCFLSKLGQLNDNKVGYTNLFHCFKRLHLPDLQCKDKQQK